MVRTTRGDGTYGSHTVAKAMAHTTEHYKGNGKKVRRRRSIEMERDQLIAALTEANDVGQVFKRIDEIGRFNRADQGLIKTKLRDVYGKSLNLNDLSAALKQIRTQRNQAVRQKGSGNGLPAIVTTGRQLRDIIQECINALDIANEPPDLFVRSGSVVRIRVDSHDGDHGIQQLTRTDRATMCDHMTQVADFIGYDKEGLPFADKPALTWGEMILCRRNLPFPPLNSLIESPVLRPDGSIVLKPGYDPATRLFLIPGPDLHIPDISENPTQTDVQNAIQRINEAIADFPFVDDSSIANLYALLLSVVMRPVINGNIPLALIDAPKQGTGKGLLANVVYQITTGRSATIMTAPARYNDEEWRKRITSVLLRGPSIIQIDNLAGVLDSPSLAAVLTCGEWENRRLGSSETVRMPAQAIWLVTGNNIQVAGDMTRRCYWIRMDANVSCPWKRQGFAHPDLLAWVREQRGQLLAALLTIARSWIVAEQPKWSGQPLGSYEAWCHVIGGTLQYAGIEGFLSNADAFYEQADDESAQWVAFFDAWYRTFGAQVVTVKQVVDRIMATRGIHDWDDGEALRSSLPESLMTAQDKDAGNLSRRLGPILRKKRDTVYGRFQLQHVGKDGHSKLALWRVMPHSAVDAVDAKSQPLYLPHLPHIRCRPVHFINPRGGFR